jgi:primary-amine oxidase
MVLDRLKQVAAHVTGKTSPPHPFDPLSESEIERAVAIIRKEHQGLFFNAVTLWEPQKAEMMAWLADPQHTVRPHRVADIVCVGKGSKVFDGIVDLNEGKLVKWEAMEGVQPLVSQFHSRSLVVEMLTLDRLPWRTFN